MSKRIFYHTQEARKRKLDAPILCQRDDAWLGNAYYFWLDIEDAEDWEIAQKEDICGMMFTNVKSKPKMF